MLYYFEWRVEYLPRAKTLHSAVSQIMKWYIKSIRIIIEFSCNVSEKRKQYIIKAIYEIAKEEMEEKIQRRWAILKTFFALIRLQNQWKLSKK